MLCHPERKRRIARMQMRGSHSGCVIYLLWRDPSPSARFEMTRAWLSDLPWTPQLSLQREVLPSLAALSAASPGPVSSSPPLRPASHLLLPLRLGVSHDNSYSISPSHSCVKVKRRSVRVYLTQIPCPSLSLQMGKPRRKSGNSCKPRYRYRRFSDKTAVCPCNPASCPRS